MSIAEKLTQIAENEQKVYDAGYVIGYTEGENKGFESGYNEGYEKGKSEGGDTDAAYEQGVADGKQAEYDAFWDIYQSNGNRATYDYMFAGNGWENTIFKPKYNIKPTRANEMFTMTYISKDLVAKLTECGVQLDFSNCTMVHQLFANASQITRIGVMDFSKITYGSQWFINASSLVTIDKLILSETTVAPSSAFDGCSKLESLTIEGVLNKNSLNLKWSTKLSKASIESIINALSTTTSGLAVTLSKTAVNAAFETSAGAADGATSTEWATLISTKSNWTINLV